MNDNDGSDNDNDLNDGHGDGSDENDGNDDGSDNDHTVRETYYKSKMSPYTP